MVASMEAIKFVSLSTPKLMTGPWMSQFAIYIMDMSLPLETLKCALVYVVGLHNTYTVLSDKVAVNLERSMITCYFQHEIIKQASYCVELYIKTPLNTYQTSSCEKKIDVYHIPTITYITSVQGSPNQYMIDTDIFGYYLQNWQSQWLCFFYLFEEHLNTPVKIKYGELQEAFLSSDKRQI